MPERCVLDASPLIALAKIGQVRLLEELADQLVLPAAVVEEVLEGPPEDPARRLLDTGFGARVAPRSLSPRILAWGLGRGESEVLSLGLEQEEAVVVIDDAAARRCALALGIPMIGTLGVVARARRLGRIDAAATVFEALKDAGFRIDEKTLQTVLGELGES